MDKMDNETAIAYIESMLSAYYTSHIVDNNNPAYRMIWVSENDSIALETALKNLKSSLERSWKITDISDEELAEIKQAALKQFEDKERENVY